jgi:hypothetical protein
MARRPVDPRRRQTRARRTSPPLRADKEQPVATRSRCSSLPHRRKALALIERRGGLSSSSRALGGRLAWPMELFDGLRPVSSSGKGRRSAGLLRMSGRSHRGVGSGEDAPVVPRPQTPADHCPQDHGRTGPRTWRTFMQPPAVGIGPTLQQSTRAPRASRPTRAQAGARSLGSCAGPVRPRADPYWRARGLRAR